jgi:hypothetical protein
MTTMPNALASAVFLVIGIALAGLLHSAWLRSSASTRWARPLDAGLCFRGRRLLGDNKTVRGFMVIVPASAASFGALALLLSLPDGGIPADLWPLTPAGYAALGALAGFGFMLGELPNSFVKRQLDIAPGTVPRSRAGRLIAHVADRLDSAVGVLLAVSIATPTPLATWLYVLLLGPPVHAAFSFLLFRLGVKERAA